MFAYQVGVADGYHCNGQTLDIENLELNVPKFRIAFYIKEQEGRPAVCIEYDNGRYSRNLMQSLAQSVCQAAKAFVANHDQPLTQISLLDETQTAVLDGFNQTEVDYDDTQNIVSLFRRQVEQTPDNLAVVYHEKRFTYREVDAISERIAAYIATQGLGNEDVVSVLITRCEWMVLAALGVLKAGCAYQPLDPSYPAERLDFMMKDAGAKLLIADEGLRHLVDGNQGKVLLTNEINNLPNTNRQHQANITPSNLFILLYTSGSTGTPKGCQLEHGNLVAFCHWYQRHYGLTAADRVAAYASYGFDACMMDLYPALTCGACVHIIGEDIRLNLPDLNEYFNSNGITHSFITTQVGYQFATNVENHSLRCFAVGGEKLSALNPPTNYKMYNGYGPTECTIFTTNYWVKDYESDIPIGKPLDNLKLYIVDKQFSKGTEIEDVNVGGTAHCVRFCLQNDTRLIHVSTYSTAGMSINGMPPENTVYTEQKLYFGQNLRNQYAHSKFLSERVVLDAVALHKLNAKVMRVGNLAPRSTDGEFQINFQTNSAMGRIRVYEMLGCYPYELADAPMEFSPINEVAKAIVMLSETPQSCTVFHPFNNHAVHFGDVLAELSQIGKAPRQVESATFNEALEAAKQDPEKAKRLSSLLAYQDMAHGQKAVMIPADNQYTTQVLYRLGFRWSSTSWDYVDQMLMAINGFGYFD